MAKRPKKRRKLAERGSPLSENEDLAWAGETGGIKNKSSHWSHFAVSPLKAHF